MARRDLSGVLTDTSAFNALLSASDDTIQKALDTLDNHTHSQYATLASPTFTGTPAAPTAAVNTNTTQVATTAFVIAQGEATTVPLINGTAAAGTSWKLAKTDHVHPTDTTRAALASPTFTGTPAAPTAAADTSTTQIATTAFVIGQGYLKSATASSTYAPLASPTFTGTVTAATLDLTTAATATAATSYFVETGSDGVVRPKTLANVKTEVVTTAAVNSAAATTVGTVTSGTWNGSVVAGQYGGTGVANTGKTITLGGNLTTSGAFATTLTVTGTTTVTLPTSGTLEVTGHTHAAYAPLASPTFTGTPAAPTAAADTNTTQIATTAYVVGQGYLKSATASSTYAPLSTPTFSKAGMTTVQIADGASIATAGAVNTLHIIQATAGADAFMTFHVAGDYAAHLGVDGTTNDLSYGGWSAGAAKYRVWHAGNDGASSGLDADLLDGQHGSYYATKTTPVFTGISKINSYNGTAASPTEHTDWPVPALTIASFGDFTLQTMLAFELPNDGAYQTGFTTWNFKLDQVASSITSAGVSGLQFGGPGYIMFAPGGTEKLRIAADGTATFTGSVIAPTATAGTNTTQVATTAFVTTAVASASPAVLSPFLLMGA